MDRRFIIVLPALILTPIVVGCGRSSSSTTAAKSPLQHAERYAALPGLSSSPHPGLQAELALLQQEHMSPLLLDARAGMVLAPSDDDSHSPRRALTDAIPAISRPLLRAQLDEVYSGGPLLLSPVQLERAREISRRWADDRLRFEQAITSSTDGLRLRVADGVLADMQFLDVLKIGCRLEALVAAEALAENQPDTGLAPLAVMLRSARLLAAERSVTTRVAAANLRADALHVLSAIANHERATGETHERLLALLDHETVNWPSDQAAWIGDRAAGLTAYEIVRDGYYLSLLEQAELEQLRKEGLVAATAKAVMRNLDHDELFYLQAMRRIIECCQRPYYERALELAEIRRELRELEQSGDYPLVAGRLLLNDFETGHRRQAEDLTRTLGWKLALQHATGREVPALVINPLTGEALEVQQSAGALRIAGLERTAAGPVEIVLRPAVQQARRPGPR